MSLLKDAGEAKIHRLFQPEKLSTLSKEHIFHVMIEEMFKEIMVCKVVIGPPKVLGPIRYSTKVPPNSLRSPLI